MKAALEPGKALVLRRCSRSSTGRLLSFGGFTWPEEIGARVVAEDFKEEPRCGNGLHGLLWGKGDVNFLFRTPWFKDLDESSVYLVVEVDSDRIVEIDREKVKFPECVIRYIGDMHGAVEYMNRYDPMLDDLTDKMDALTRYAHKYYALNTDSRSPCTRCDDPYCAHVDKRPFVEIPLSHASNLISSEIKCSPQRHSVIIDVDHPVHVRESSQGKSHLYIDVPLTWDDYVKVLKVLADVGIIERGYLAASLERGFTSVRTPWAKKRLPY